MRSMRRPSEDPPRLSTHPPAGAVILSHQLQFYDFWGIAGTEAPKPWRPGVRAHHELGVLGRAVTKGKDASAGSMSLTRQGMSSTSSAKPRKSMKQIVARAAL